MVLRQTDPYYKFKKDDWNVIEWDDSIDGYPPDRLDGVSMLRGEPTAPNAPKQPGPVVLAQAVSDVGQTLALTYERTKEGVEYKVSYNGQFVEAPVFRQRIGPQRNAPVSLYVEWAGLSLTYVHVEN